ncbi:MAG TPA: dihydrolipoyl dehydrogenase [Desulfomonilia bacterium]|nr:dihydrolipoyl dehydrogenase [Desulfomonilia bacterium]
MGAEKAYDLFIIGAGPGGYTAALLGARKGLRVGIAEGSDCGGTCTNRGCIPAKSYIESINLLAHMKNASRFGIDPVAASVSLENLQRRKTRIVGRLVKGIEHLLSRSGVDLFRGSARFEGEKTIRIDDRFIHASSIIIATGSRPKRPTLFELPGMLTSDEVFDLRQAPGSMIIVGGGVIGMEMAHIFSNLGTEVTVIEALERVLSTEDEEVSKSLVSLYRKVRFMTSARVAAAGKDPEFVLTVDNPAGRETLRAASLLLCIGREPSLPAGLVHLGIALTPSGGIQTDGSMRTSLPGVYAVGDVTGEHMYAYVASREAEVAVAHITGDAARTMDYSVVPSVVFTHPEIASVGRKPGGRDTTGMRKGTFPVSALGRARTMEESEGFATITCDPDGTLERVTIMAPHATELIAWATLAVERRLHVEEFLRPFYPHPTMAELLKEAAEDVLGLSINKP